jgi:hypothetical protein
VKRDTQAKQSKWIVYAAAVVVIVAGWLLWRMFSSNSTKLAEPTASTENTPERIELKLAYAAAKAALESPGWEQMKTHVLAPERVAPLMEWYYRKHPQGYQQRSIISSDKELIDLTRTPPTATLRLQPSTGSSMHVLLEQSNDGWRLDWESFSNVYAVLWDAFLQGKDGLPKQLVFPLEIESCPASALLPSWFTTTKQPKANEARAVRLYIGQPTNAGAACWAEQDPLGKEILAELAAQPKLKWLLDVSLIDSTVFPPAVKINRIVAKKWNNPPQPQPSEAKESKEAKDEAASK